MIFIHLVILILILTPSIWLSYICTFSYQFITKILIPGDFPPSISPQPQQDKVLATDLCQIVSERTNTYLRESTHPNLTWADLSDFPRDEKYGIYQNCPPWPPLQCTHPTLQWGHPSKSQKADEDWTSLLIIATTIILVIIVITFNTIMIVFITIISWEARWRFPPKADKPCSFQGLGSEC